MKGYDHYHWEIILGFMILLWINDTFAYITGSLTGKHLLFPEISPKKTWEGTIGGILMTIIVSIVLSYIMDTLNTSHWIFIGIITAITGTLGDLTESKIKRNLDVKNSGTFLPGHGGILDRTDSMLIALPCVFIYLYMIQNII
ncbi:MAG: phosphatidate cytidylyltransferase [Bacteroidota bacterium]